MIAPHMGQLNHGMGLLHVALSGFKESFCQLRKSFWQDAQVILPEAQVILQGGASHFDEGPGLGRAGKARAKP